MKRARRWAALSAAAIAAALGALALPIAGHAPSARHAAQGPPPPRAPVVVSESQSPLTTGESLLRRGAYRSARRALGQALDMARASGDPASEIDARAALARADDLLGDPSGAAREREEALALARRTGDRRREAAILSEAGLAHAVRAEAGEGRRLLRRALGAQEALGDRAGAARTRSNLGYLAYKEGRYPEALRELGGALDVATALEDDPLVADIHLWIGLAHLDRRDYNEAIAAFRASSDRATASGDLARRVAALDHVAIAYLFQGAPAEARAVLAQSLDLATGAGDRALEMRVRHLLANALRQAGRHHEAIAEYDQVGAWFEAEGDRSEAAWIRYRRGRSEQALGRLADAEASWRAALELWQSLGERRAAAWVEYELARLLETLGRTDEALAAYERAATAQHVIALPYASLPMGDRALLLARNGRMPAARAAAADAVVASESVDNPEMRWQALYRRGQVERLAGRPADALASWRSALAVIEAMRTRVDPIDEARAGFMASHQEVYAAMVDLLVGMGRPGEALEISERARARAFLDLIGAGTDGQEPGASASISGVGADVARGLSVPPLGLEGIRAEVRRRRVTLLEYFTGAERSFVFAVPLEGTVQAATIASGADLLAAEIVALRRDLEAGAENPAALRALYDLLIEPLAAALPQDPEAPIVIVPHGPLALLPFAALQDTGGVYLVERHTLACAPAAGALRLSGSRRSAAAAGGGAMAGGGVLAVGNPAQGTDLTRGGAMAPLPDAEAEARAVFHALHGEAGSLLVGADATEARVRALMPRRQVLHFATHAVVVSGDPFASRLVLARASDLPSDDGRLTAAEIATLHLDARLVTLSACDSGLGDAAGEGVGLLARVFLHAGARSLVVSLWRLSDVAGRAQMERFYLAYADAGLGPARALRRAQIETLESLRRGEISGADGRPLPPSPGFWAPLIVLGEPS